MTAPTQEITHDELDLEAETVENLEPTDEEANGVRGGLMSPSTRPFN